MKGLIRSLERAPKSKQLIVKQIVAPISLTVSVTAAGAAVGFGTAVLEGLPEGNIAFFAAVANLLLSGSGSDANLVDDWEGDFSLGTTATTDVTLDSTDVNIVASTPVGPAVAEVSPLTRGVGTGISVFDNTDGSLEINLNVLIDAADIVDGQTVALTVTGEAYISYVVLGDD